MFWRRFGAGKACVLITRQVEVKIDVRGQPRRLSLYRHDTLEVKEEEEASWDLKSDGRN